MMWILHGKYDRPGMARGVADGLGLLGWQTMILNNRRGTVYVFKRQQK